MALIDRIKFDGPPDILVWKYPKDNIVLGSQLIVNQSQEAVFFKDGRALDVFGPGVHTIVAKNIPLLQRLVNLPFGGETPFAAEVFIVNKVARLDYKWGTRTPIPIEDPKYGVVVSVGAFGQFGLRLSDARAFVTGIVGTMPMWDGAKVTEYFRGLVITRVKDNIARYLVQKGISIVEISAYQDELSKVAEAAIRDEFARFGLDLLNFFIASIDIPEDQLKPIREIQTQRLQMKTLGTEGYKTKRSFDVMEAAAGNPGAPGTLLAGGMGLGMGVQMMKQAGEMAQGTAAAQQTMVECPKCHGQSSAGSRFCNQCGADLAPVAKCPHCGAESTPGSKFCSQCGKPLGSAKCPSCGAENPPAAKFCSNCAKPMGG